MKPPLARVTRYFLAGLILSLLVTVAFGLPGGNARIRQSQTTPLRTKAPFVGSIDYITETREEGRTIEQIARESLDEVRRDRYAQPGEAPFGDASNSPDIPASDTWVRITTWGVPFESFWSWQVMQRRGVYSGGDWLPLVITPRGPGMRLFPYLPIWTGVVGNAGVCGVAAWGVIAGLRQSRGALRRRRGRCARCAYDLRGTPIGPCPECGDADPRRHPAVGPSSPVW